MEILGGELKRNETNEKAMGGTELMATRLFNSFEPDFFKEFQIIFSRVRELDPTKVRILCLHDLPGDPESDAALKNDGWKHFHKLVFVSNWQMQQYCAFYQIPYGRCLVLANAVEPIEEHEKPKDVIRLGYWSTPHRGLNILVPVFKKLCETHDNIELDVFSSFSLYGWNDRDKDYEFLFEECREHPKINYHGTVDNETLREALKSIHILAYPNVWVETSCLVLMEAMTARIVSVHPNLGALFETAANWTSMYQFTEDLQNHAEHFCAMLDSTIKEYGAEGSEVRLNAQKTYADVFYSWPVRKQQWQAFLDSRIKDLPRELPSDSDEYFSVKIT